MMLKPDIQRYVSEAEHTYLLPCIRYAAASVDWGIEKFFGR